MTVATTNRFSPFTPNGVQLIFGFTFRCDVAAWISAVLDNVAIGGYTVFLNADQTASPGGTVTFGVAPVGTLLIIRRDTSLTQTTVYNPYGRFPAKSHEAALDKLTLQVQDFAETASRAAQYVIGTDPALQVKTFPAYVANKVWAWHPTLAGVVINTDLSFGLASSPVSVAMEPVVAGATVPVAMEIVRNGLVAEAIIADDDEIMLRDTSVATVKRMTVANFIKSILETARTFTGLQTLAAGQTITAGLQTLAAGADIASAATVNLATATGNVPRITGTVATSAVTMNTGQWALVIADGAWPLTYSSTNNRINTGGANITLAAGDRVLYHRDLSGIVHGFIMKANGTPVVVATVAEVKTGTITDKPIAPDALLAALGFSARYNSGQQTITAAGALVLAHGLGRRPILFTIKLYCVTAELGYSIGDETLPGIVGPNTNTGLSVVPDATNINIRYGSGAATFTVVNKTTGAVGNVTNANWKLIVEAWG